MSYLHNKNFIAAINYLYKKIDQPIVIDDIAKAVGLSTSSLKRLFLEATNLSIGAFIRRLRMEHAFRTLKNKETSILEVALSCGFENHSAFSRAFKENFGYPPTFARKKVNIVDELECITLEEPEFIEINEIKIQAVTTKGSYFEAAPRAWQSLQNHLMETELNDDFTGTFIGIGHDNPHDGNVSENHVRFSAGIAFDSRNLHIQQIMLNQGTYAKFNYKGKPNTLGLAYHYIYGSWSTQAAVKINELIPAFMVFDTLPSEFKIQNITIYIPLQNQ